MATATRTVLHRSGPRPVPAALLAAESEPPRSANVGPAKAMPTREELSRRRDTLRAARGRAVLDGEVFNCAELDAVEAALEACDDAEAEEVRRERAEAAQAAAQRRAGVVAVVARLDGERLAAMAAAEQAAAAMVVALSEARRLASEIAYAMMPLGPAVPASLMAAAVDRRIATFIAGALYPIRTDQYSLGGTLEWHAPVAPITGWAEVERDRTSRDITALLEGTPKQ
jgi:hypothetical protein